jgi:hypothetical protein
VRRLLAVAPMTKRSRFASSDAKLVPLVCCGGSVANGFAGEGAGFQVCNRGRGTAGDADAGVDVITSSARPTQRCKKRKKLEAKGIGKKKKEEASATQQSFLFESGRHRGLDLQRDVLAGRGGIEA